MTTAVTKLQQSKLAPPNKLQLMGGDLNLTEFYMQMRNKAGIRLASSITDAQLERTIDGASTLTVTVEDSASREIQRSGRLGRKVDVNLDGLWFTLVAINKTGRNVQLTYEEREVNVLRYYSKFIMAPRSTTTRAQFILRMLKEVKEIPLKWVIPELGIVQPISDAAKGQIIVDSFGNPASTVTNQGINASSSLTVKGQAATPEQISNADAIITTGVGLKASRKVLVCSIMTVIDESVLINLVGGDRDSVGLFQQRRSQGWPATRNIPVDATAFFDAAIKLDKQYPTISYNDLCQGVQNSGTPNAYGQYQSEGEAFVDAYGVAGGNVSSAVGTVAGQTSNNQIQTTPASNQPQAALSGNYFTRGTLSQKGTSFILTPENSWNCMQRLAREVNWRCFCVSGVIYFVSEKYLFQGKPLMVISEDSPGIDWIDYDYDEGKKTANVTVTCHLSRWSAPPGSIVVIKDMGVINGRWIISDVSRSLYNAEGTVTLSKPDPVLPEPTTLVNLPSGFVGPPTPAGARNGTTNNVVGTDIQKRIVAYVTSQLGVPYLWGTEAPGKSFDCSGLAQAAYNSVGITLPRVAQDQYNQGPRVFGDLMPGDLVFFGTSTNIHHVGIYIGNGSMIDAPHHNSVVRVDANFQTIWPDYYGATRPWQLGNSKTGGGKPG